MSQLTQTSLERLVSTALRQGDVERGKAVFQREKLGCIKCHGLSQKTDQPLAGPGLTFIGDQLRPGQIAESILKPNENISEGFQSYIVLTLDGSLHNGVLHQQTNEEVVLIDADKGQIRIPTEDIDEMKKTKSAMPEKLVNDLADANEFYDLVQYLVSRKASTAGTPVVAEEKIVVKEIARDKKPMPLLAIARPDGICYTYDPNLFRLDTIWQGPLGWETEDGQLILNQSSSESFYLRDKPWFIDTRKIEFDFKWLGYEVIDDEVVMRFELKDKKEGRTWRVEESIETPSLTQQRLRFRIKHPPKSHEVLTFWLWQTNYRTVSTNGQQAQRNQLEFLKPGQTDFVVNLARRRSGQTVPDGYSISRIEGPKPRGPFVFEPTGFSFAADGTAFASTRTGNVWRYKDGKWNLFADGLQETQGVQVAPNGRDVYAMQKPELTLLEDADDDGRADVYRSVANGYRYTGQYHEFAFGPVRSSNGEMYFSTGLSSSGNHEVKESGTGQMSSALGYRGWVLNVSPNGKLTPFACGLRSPAGIGMNAKDELFITDNQGDWVASSYLGHVEKGDFMGHPASLWDREEFKLTPRELNYMTIDARIKNVPKLDEAKFAAQRKRPAVWLVHGDLTNSPGNPSFCPPIGFGPFEGQAFIADISHRSIVRVSLEKVNGVYQGAVFPFIRPLGSAAFATSFDPKGNLWVGSVSRGWTTGDPIIEVISFDSAQSPFEMHRIQLTPGGFDIHFTQPLADSAIPNEQIIVRQFHYLYWGEYGSDRQDLTEIPIESTSLSSDRRTLHIALPVAKNKVYEFNLGMIRSSKGQELKNNYAFYTLNELAK